VSADAQTLERPSGAAGTAAPSWRSRAWGIVAALSVTETVSWGAHATDPRGPSQPSVRAGEALRASSFWLLSAAFVLGSLTTIALTVHTIPFLLQRGHSAAFAAFAVGLIGVSQIPGRLLFAPLATLLPRPLSTASVFALIGLGVALLVSVDSTAAAIAGLVLLGMGNGMATLARATTIADLYGPGSYGAIVSVAGAMITAARAIGPVSAAVYAAAVGYTALLWTLVVLALAAVLLAYRAADD
jgi:predicted MFS family arabinose efflux permease